MKRITSFTLVCVILISVFSFNISAASYPLIFPKTYDLYVPKGQVAELEFTMYHEFKNEMYHINLYKGDSVDTSKLQLVGSAEDTVYATTFATNVTITWDTANKECGVYTVEYYTSFYTMYEWHDAPSKSALMRVIVFEPGTTCGAVLNTDIKATIDGRDIRSYNIEGRTAIVAEDLAMYGFNVVYNNDDRTLKITEGSKYITSQYVHTPNTLEVGSKAMDVYYTDIKTYIDDTQVKSFNVNGYTIIYIDDLDEFGTVVWDPNTRIISFTR